MAGSRRCTGHDGSPLLVGLAALGRDLGDLQDILAGTYLDKMMDGDAGPRLDREHGEKVRAAYLEALRARRAVARLAADGVYPFEGGYPKRTASNARRCTSY